MPFLRLVAAIFLAGVAAGAVWWFADRPVPVAAEYSKPFYSMSFAAYRRGESPLTQTYPTPQEVEQDLQVLVGRTRNIRTYTSREGLEHLPELAEKYGIKMTLGIWLGTDKDINEKELAQGIKEANEHPESVTQVMVGNEVLLRGDLTPDELIGYIRRVKEAVKQPVSTADVWSFVLRYPQVGRELDFISIHVLPFWDDEPVSIDQAEQHLIDIVGQTHQAFPGKRLLIAETCWPSIGRDRGPSVVDVVHEADYIRRVAVLADRLDYDYNIMEAFDQPWKSALENTVGAAWGVLDADRDHGRGIEKFPMKGPVLQVADWKIRAGWAIAVGIIATLLLGRAPPSFGAALAFAVAAQILSWLTITSIFHAHAVTFRSWQYYWLILRVALPVLLFGAIVARLKDWLSGDESDASRLWRGHWLMPLTAVYGLAWSLMLLFDGRYRDIPEFDFALPVGGLLVMAAIRLTVARHPGESWRGALAINELFPGRYHRNIRLLGGLMLAMVPLSLIGEAWALGSARDFIIAHPTFREQLPYLLNGLVWNREMDLWSAMQLLWAVPFLLAGAPAAPTRPA
ncbi:MAG TPA: exo-beta-1,3-glucanase [Magnetospirillaceae bacterium]|nr:exo-beta-1,3-glucanase [Magnetospirillaceae bacterium]